MRKLYIYIPVPTNGAHSVNQAFTIRCLPETGLNLDDSAGSSFSF